jgi:glycosyltransferase involved in cell wall biosynthesis
MRFAWPNARLRKPVAAQRIALLQNVCPDYRQEPFSLLRDHWGERFEILAGRVSFDPTARTQVELPDCLRIIRNYFFFKRRLLWQHGAIRKILAADVAILELNPRNLTTWTALVARGVMSRHTVLWGHAWPRQGPDASTDRLRHWMRSLPDVLLLYTETQRVELSSIMPNARIYTAPNALYHEDEMSATTNGTPTDIVFVGRLVPAKKPLLLFDAFARAVASGLPPSYNLLFAGDGPERSKIEASLEEAPELRKRVTMLGHVPSAQVRDIYRSALVSVSPGYVGLSITQSFSFGVPMIVARDEPHAPEIEAAVDGKNAVFVPSCAPDALAEAILKFAKDSSIWLDRREDIVLDCAARYTVEKMAQGIIAAAEANMPPSDEYDRGDAPRELAGR